MAYNLHLLRKNAPWIAHIHLITDAQRPSWLTSEMEAALDVRIVDHREIFAGHEHLLPVFNSRSLESMMHRTPGLSDFFLYLNDDFFLVDATQMSDYFDPLPVLRGTLRASPPRQRELIAEELTNLWARFWPGKVRDGYVGPAAEQKLLMARHPHRFALAHAPVPVCRGDLTRAMETHDGLSNAAHRFRSNAQFRPLALLATQAIAEGRARIGPIDWEYLDPSKHTRSVIRHRLNRCRSDRSVKSVCVQSMDLAKSPRADIETFLEDCLS